MLVLIGGGTLGVNQYLRVNPLSDNDNDIYFILAYADEKNGTKYDTTLVLQYREESINKWWKVVYQIMRELSGEEVEYGVTGSGHSAGLIGIIVGSILGVLALFFCFYCCRRVSSEV